MMTMIIIMIINQLLIVRVANILVLVFLGTAFKTSTKEKYKNYHYIISTQILKGISYSFKDLK